jgi:heterodisulfide reductase subunit B
VSEEGTEKAPSGPPPEKGPVRVDFAFRRELARKVEGNLASFCYQCGACVGDCPATTYSDRFNPREIMLEVLYGLGDELLKEDSVLWLCTNCYNCHERCPQEVKPVEVIISLKNMLADRGIVPETAKRIIHTFETTGRTTPGGPAVDKQRERFGLPPLAPVPMDEIQALLEPDAEKPEPLLQETRDRAPEARSAPTRARDGQKRFAFFPGCLIPARHPAMESAIRSTLTNLGVEIADLDGASCCPDPIYFKSKDKMTWLSVAARNLTLAQEQGLDVFTNCSGCTATLSETRHLLEDEELRGKVNGRLRRIGRHYDGTTRVKHVAALLRDEVGYEAIKQSVKRPLTGLKVAIHYGCHLLKPSRIMQVDDPNNPEVLEKLVEALGATPVRHSNWYLCCGKACQAEDVPLNMMHDLLRAVHKEEAELLCLICPTCFGQFDHGQAKVAKRFEEDFHTPAIYYLQLLAFAQGVPYDDLGLERQRFKVDCLKRFESPDERKSVPIPAAPRAKTSA